MALPQGRPKAPARLHGVWLAKCMTGCIADILHCRADVPVQRYDAAVYHHGDK
jgi:hypothetical protein